MEHDNEEVTVLPKEEFIRSLDETLKTRLRSEEREKIVSEALDALKTKGVAPLKTALRDWREEDGLIFFKNKCYVLKIFELQQEIVKNHHDPAPFGHPGFQKTLELIRRDYWWLKMYQFIHNYVEGCAICQQNKINTHPTTPPLSPLKAPENQRPFSMVTIDMITGYPNQNQTRMMRKLPMP